MAEVIDPKTPPALTDGQIVTERKFPRRSFVTAAGAFLTGAGVLVAGMRAEAQEKPADPDQKKKGKKKGKKKASKASDPDQKK